MVHPPIFWSHAEENIGTFLIFSTHSKDVAGMHEKSGQLKSADSAFVCLIYKICSVVVLWAIFLTGLVVSMFTAPIKVFFNPQWVPVSPTASTNLHADKWFNINGVAKHSYAKSHRKAPFSWGAALNRESGYAEVNLSRLVTTSSPVSNSFIYSAPVSVNRNKFVIRFTQFGPNDVIGDLSSPLGYWCVRIAHLFCLSSLLPIEVPKRARKFKYRQENIFSKVVQG